MHTNDWSEERRHRLLRRRRSIVWSFVALLVLAIALPFTGYLAVETGAVAPAVAQTEQGRQFSEDRATNPRSDTWRHVRRDGEGTTTASGPYVVNNLISNIGQNWRQIRNGPIKTYGAIIMGLSLLAIGAFYLMRGRIPIEGGRSGYVVPRWSAFDRTVHWCVAGSFVLLAATGLALLFGRHVLMPIFGDAGFAAFAQASMYVHNFLGPLFGVLLVVMIIRWFKPNIPAKHDLQWFKEGGGIVGDKHPPAGEANGGEKVWFWIGVVLFGVTVTVTGFILDFPNFGQSRDVMAWAHVLHASVALVWIALFFGHAYIGTLGTEGALEGMTTGKVDVAWAKQHHDLWYEELIQEGVQPVRDDRWGGQTPGSSAETGGAGGT